MIDDVQPIRVLELRSVRGTGGGPEKTILLGAARADRARYAVTVCYLRDARDQVFHVDARAQDLPIDYVEVTERHSFDPSAWRSLRALVRSRHIDIVHAHEYKTDALAWALGHAEPVIPLATAHGWTGHSFRERHVYYPGDRFVLRRYPRVIAVSSDIRRALVRSGARPERVTVVLNGIDHEQFRREPEREAHARSAFGLPDAAIVLGSVGRLEPQKNFPMLLRAFAGLSSRYPRAVLVIAGEGSARGDLELLGRSLGLDHRFRLLGHVSEVGLLHHALDLFIQSSDYEGTANSVLEAMAFGTPIVATAAGGTAELVRHGEDGLVVPVSDETALVSAIDDALSHRENTLARARSARCRVERELSFLARMQKVEGIYEELMQHYACVRQGRRWWEK